MSEGNEREIEKDEKLSFKNGKKGLRCMKSFWSRQLSVCIIIILTLMMFFLPFYFVNSKHTQVQHSFSTFKRGCKLIKTKRYKYCCVTFSEIKQMDISPTTKTAVVVVILLCLVDETYSVPNVYSLFLNS